MNKTLIKLFLFCCLLFYACQQEFIDDESNKKLSFNVDDACIYFESMAEELAPLSFNHQQILARASQVSETNIIPEWK